MWTLWMCSSRGSENTTLICSCSDLDSHMVLFTGLITDRRCFCTRISGDLPHYQHPPRHGFGNIQRDFWWWCSDSTHDRTESPAAPQAVPDQELCVWWRPQVRHTSCCQTVQIHRWDLNEMCCLCLQDHSDQPWEREDIQCNKARYESHSNTYRVYFTPKSKSKE